MKLRNRDVPESTDVSDSTPKKISPFPFYGEWKGHTIPHLTTYHSIASSLRPGKPVIYLAGDSSLDNKFWVPGSGPGGDPLPVEVPEIYYSILDRPKPKPDVAFWMNHYLGDQATVINTSIEASMLRERQSGLLPQDEFIRDHITANDVLVVSVGGNDIALSPTVSTALRMLQLAWLSSRSSLERGNAWSLGYFRQLFGTQIQAYVEKLVERQKPRAVIICMIYFPLEQEFSSQNSWADRQLKLLGYSKDPKQLQAGIRSIFETAMKQIRVEGTGIIPCALYEVMDGKNADDYTERVEPSVQGGRKMAELLKRKLDSVVA
ncbi:uncharacterized protein BDZ99DRAFT_89905 [Mytilinidion resinicola]|uniref:SGNH hydrolase n=1 Tax=Mytilinidion resinicola TaxID=574789 RepID=A0A6A6YE49_9PEZI|nr:uncharacterized protein BDZ99DRAFT_89905 [Mytilinidion resinicola]KAF2807010.1 hypothetical protein BDZ99DRAFT_89905 [Mytilinidion resinicola]